MKTSKISALILAIGLGALSANAALTLNWTYGGNLAIPVPSVQVGWVVQMYQDVGVDTLLSSITAFNASDMPQGTGASNDQLLGSFQTAVGSAKGTFSFANVGLSADALAGLTVYTVLFNNTVLSSASQAWIIDSTAPTTLPASGTASYTPNTTASTVGYGPIAVVPEPSSIALIGIGLAAIGLRRRFVK